MTHHFSSESTAFDAALSAAGRTPRAAWLERLASAPFVHFTLLGALVFVGHGLLTPTPEPRAIDVPVSRQRELTKLFEQRTKRAPTEEERAALIQHHIEGEALFREGLRLSLVETDPVLREQLITRVSGLLRPPRDEAPPTEGELRLHYDAHRSDYVIPETISYLEYWIARGPQAGAEARSLLQALQTEQAPRTEEQPDSDLPAATEFEARSEAQLLSLYDEEVARALWTLSDEGWHELRSERGIHIVRHQSRTPGRQLPFEEVRERVDQSYRKDRAERAFQAELDRLVAQWQVNVEKAP